MKGHEAGWLDERTELRDPEPESHVGPGTQGAALILELRRLQAALEHSLHERRPAARPPASSPKPTARISQIEYHARARPEATRTDGLMTIGARWLVAFIQFAFARPGAENAPARRDATRTDGPMTIGTRWLVAFFQFVFARPGAGNAPTGALGTRMDYALTTQLRTGLRVLIAAVVIAGGWGTFVPLGGAIVAPGVIVVESKIKKVQHPSGGIV